jgi:hypothetical protein
MMPVLFKRREQSRSSSCSFMRVGEAAASAQHFFNLLGCRVRVPGANAATRDFAGKFVQSQGKLDSLAGSHLAVAFDLKFSGLLGCHSEMLYWFERLNKPRNAVGLSN